MQQFLDKDEDRTISSSGDQVIIDNLESTFDTIQSEVASRCSSAQTCASQASTSSRQSSRRLRDPVFTSHKSCVNKIK